MNPIEKSMIVDLHAHYAMHLMDEHHHNPMKALRWVVSASASPQPPGWLSEEARVRYVRHHRARRQSALSLSLLRLINLMFNYRSITSGPGVTLEQMKKGGVGVVLSPLYDPHNEFGLVSTWLAFVVFLLGGTILALLASLVVTYIGSWAFVVVAPVALVSVLVLRNRQATVTVLLVSLVVVLIWHWGVANLIPYFLASAIGIGVILLTLVVILAVHHRVAAALLALASLVVALIGHWVGVFAVLLTMMAALAFDNRLAAVLLFSSLVAAVIGRWVKASGIEHLGPGLLGSAVGMFVVLSALVAGMALYNWLASSFGWWVDGLPGSPPRSEYVGSLCEQLEKVEQDVAAVGDWAVVAHDFDHLKRAMERKQIAIIHCVEGGFQLGATATEIEDNVARLAKRGVAYVTLAHLFFRGIATNASAIPFLSDWLYHILYHQPRRGLTPLGEAAVTAMFRNGVLIDVTHMNEQAISETFTLLENLERKYCVPPVPVLASHIACRFGKYEYNLSCDTISMIGERNGVMGVIFCDHWMSDGPRKHDPRTARRTFQIVRENIDRIEQVTKSNHQCAAIGSDLDGFIKPMLRGLEDMGCVRDLENWLIQEYGRETADLILHRNARRVLESAWGDAKLMQAVRQKEQFEAARTQTIS